MFEGIGKGIGSYMDALKCISRYQLMPYLLLSAFIGFLIGAVVIYGVYLISDDIGLWLSGIWIWDWGKEAFLKFAQGLTVVLSLLVFFFTFKYVVFIVMAPLLSLVSQKLEKRMLGTVRDSGMNLFQEFLRGLRLALRNIVREILITLVLVIAGLIFPFLSWMTTALIFVVQAYYAGFGNMDFTLERYYNTQQSIQYVKTRRGFAIGNGSVFLALLALPLIGILLAPFLGAISAAYVEIQRHQGLN